MAKNYGRRTDMMPKTKSGSSRFTACRQTGTGDHSTEIVQQKVYGVNV